MCGVKRVMARSLIAPGRGILGATGTLEPGLEQNGTSASRTVRQGRLTRAQNFTNDEPSVGGDTCRSRGAFSPDLLSINPSGATARRRIANLEAGFGQVHRNGGRRSMKRCPEETIGRTVIKNSNASRCFFVS